MQKANIVETNLKFRNLATRNCTDMVVIHHTGAVADMSAKEIHRMHIEENGWAGIGYHYVIRKNGTIERGRPHWTTGAHAEGDNWHTISIHVCGHFSEEDFPENNNPQMEALAMLVATVCHTYGLSIDEDTVVGHRDLMATNCPGDNLYDMLDIVRGKANFYLTH